MRRRSARKRSLSDSDPIASMVDAIKPAVTPISSCRPGETYSRSRRPYAALVRPTQPEATHRRRPGDRVIAALGLELDPVGDATDVGRLLVEGHVVEHRDVELAFAPDEITASIGALLCVLVEPGAGIGNEIVDADVRIHERSFPSVSHRTDSSERLFWSRHSPSRPPFWVEFDADPARNPTQNRSAGAGPAGRTTHPPVNSTTRRTRRAGH